MLLFCFIIVVLVLLLIKWNSNKEIANYIQVENKEEEFLNLDTGDLVFVAYDNSLGKISKFWYGSKWTHVGIVYRDEEDEVFVLEVAEYNNPNFEKGVVQIPMKSWLGLNKDFEITYKHINIPIDSDNLYKIFNRYKNMKLHKLSANPKNLKKFLFPIGEDKSSLTCNELVTKIFEEMDIIPKDRFYSSSDLLLIDAKGGISGVFNSIPSGIET